MTEAHESEFLRGRPAGERRFHANAPDGPVYNLAHLCRFAGNPDMHARLRTSLCQLADRVS